MRITPIDTFWMTRFAVPAETFFSAGATVVAHESSFLAGYHGAWVFRRDNSWLIAVPEGLVSATRVAVAQLPSRDLFAQRAIRQLFGDTIDRIIGPAFQGFCNPADFRPSAARAARRLAPADAPGVERLLAACTPAERQHSTIGRDDAALFGAFTSDDPHGAELAAVANYTAEPCNTVSPGVLAHPLFRRQSYATAALSAALAHAFDVGHDLAIYQTLLSNTPALRAAHRLGFREYAQHVAVRFR